MQLRTKTWAVVLAATVTLLGAMLLIGGRVFLASFERLELDQATQETRRVLAMLERQRNDLERTARDYAEWDDTVSFAAGDLPNYPATNWTADALLNLKIRLVLVFDPAGKPVGGRQRPAGETNLKPASPEQFAAFARDVAAVLAAPDAGTRSKGSIRLGSDAWIFACTPVTTSNLPHEPRGALVIARLLDDAFVTDLSTLAQHPVTLHVTGPETEPDVPARSFTPIDNTGILLARQSEYQLTAHVPLRAPDHSTVATVHVDLARPIRQHAAQAGWLIVAQGAGITLLFSVLFSVLIGHFVVSRLEQLHAAVQRVGHENDLHVRVPARGDDEIAGLGTAINTMLDALARSRAERDQVDREREKLHEQLLHAQKMEAIGEFAGGIAHDFNNCLTAVTGWLSLVRHDLPRDSQHYEHLGLALASARHAAAVVNQLVVYSRQGPPTLSPVSLRELLGNSLQLLRSGLPRTTELQFTTTGDNDVVRGDCTQIQQIVMNLVKNAADAMDRKGRVMLALDEVRLPDTACPGSSQLAAGPYVRLAVQDTGPGIPPALHERVFEPFFSTKGAGRGTGLGLAVVRSVALRHGGAVGLSSPPGAGATFFVYLPAHDATPSTVTSSHPGYASRILIVDDDPAVRQVVAQAITNQGHEVITANDGLDGWEKFVAANPPFEIVLTDLTMPRLGGMQLGERVFNSSRRTPVLLMTAFAATLDPEQLRRAGFAALIAKPLDLDHLRQALMAARTAQ